MKGFSDYCQARQATAASAKASAYHMDAATFYNLFPYHLILDSECRVVQVGWWL